jgi:hypothetical protein
MSYKYKSLRARCSLVLNFLSRLSTLTSGRRTKHNTIHTTSSTIKQSATHIMVSMYSYRHPWPMSLIPDLTRYEREPLYDEIYDYLGTSFCTPREELRMIETMLRIYQYDMLHGSVFVRVHSNMMTMMERPSTSVQIIVQTPAAPDITMQQPQQPQQIVIQQAANQAAFGDIISRPVHVTQ